MKAIVPLVLLCLCQCAALAWAEGVESANESAWAAQLDSAARELGLPVIQLAEWQFPPLPEPREALPAPPSAPAPELDALPPGDEPYANQFKQQVPPRPGETIDLRPPDENGPFHLLNHEPSWLNDVIDDHALLYREARSEVEFLPKDSGGLGLTTLGFKSSWAGGDGPLWIEPFFNWTFLNGPLFPDIRPQVYDLGIEINLAGRISENFGLHVQLTPMFSTDFDNKTSDAFRLISSGLITYRADEVTTLVAGLCYLDRPDLPFLPVAGVRWQVLEDLQVDLLVPRPRVAWCFDRENGSESWAYLAGEVGGGSWAVEREFNRKDRMGYRDLRLLLGIETKLVSGQRHLLEAGYVFSRHLEFERYRGSQHLGGTAVLRMGTLF